MALQHLRSSTADKRPTPAAMSDGQLAMNTNLVSPGLFLKDSNGDLVKVGPVHVGTTAPNATPGAGGQAGNSKGEQWLDTSSSRYVFKIWDGTAWRTEDGEFVNVSGDTMTGALGIIAGTNTAPGVFFSGDTSTGIYSPGADQLAISTNAVERVEFGTSEVVFNDGGANYDFRIEGDTNASLFFVDASGEAVGIGTTSPGELLDVVGGNIRSTNGFVRTAGSSANAVTTRGFRQTIDGTELLAIYHDNNGAVFNVNTSERARIDSSGRFLVGTSSSSGGIRAAFQGNTNNPSGAGVVHLQRGEAAAAITADEIIGALRGTDNADNIGAEINFVADAAWGAGDYPARLMFSTTADGASSPTERMRITSAGNVGIGTTSPDAKLTALGSATISSQVNVAARIGAGTTSDVLIGSINGNAPFISSQGAYSLILRTNNTTALTIDSSQQILFSNGGSERARIDSSGRLLVGASSAYTVEGFNRHSYFCPTAGDTSNQVVVSAMGATGFPAIFFTKTRGASPTAQTIVQNNDLLGQIRFFGSDGVDYDNSAARIDCAVDGTPGANDMPGRLVFSTTADGAASPTERLRITSAGRVGIGNTTPRTTLVVGTEGGYPAGSASDSCRLVVQSADLISKNGLRVVANNYLGASEAYLDLVNFGSKNYTYESGFRLTGGVAAGGDTSNAYLAFSTTALPADTTESSGTVTLSEKMRIDSSGRLLVGTSSARSNYFNSSTYTPYIQMEGAENESRRSLSLTYGDSTGIGPILILAKHKGTSVGGTNAVSNNDEAGQISFQASDGTEFIPVAEISSSVDGTPGANDMPGRLVFSTTADGASSPTERMRISSDGFVTVNATSKLGRLSVVSSSGTSMGITTESASGNSIFSVGTTSASTDWKHFNGVSSNNTVQNILIYGNGDIQNANNSYTGLSDLRLKENIANAGSQWVDIKSIQVRKYNFKKETGQQTHTQIGLIAQEVELVSPGLVNESIDRNAKGDDLGTVTKSVNYSVLYMKAVKALQEAMERIETLETRLAAAGIA